MFNDKYGLNEAVLQRRKTMTRRIVKDANLLQWLHEMEVAEYAIKGTILEEHSTYKVGEVVAIAQSYKDAGYTKEWVEQHIQPNPNAKPTDPFEKKYPGWNNKMFVKAEFMLNFIQFTDLKIERLQDISNEDCMKEGIQRWKRGLDLYFFEEYGDFDTPREAFAALIDKVSGRGTWETNPCVFVYEFEQEKGGER